MNNFKYYPPKYKAITHLLNAKIMSETGDVALMCPECFHMVEICISNCRIANITEEIEDFNIVIGYYGVCPNCKKDIKFEIIDINMAQIISILNSKGYYTAFCCEGHIEPDTYTGNEDFSWPYIYFYLWKDSEILTSNPLPDSWCIDYDDNECEIFCIHDNITKSMPTSIINGNEIIDFDAYINWLKDNWDQKQRLEDIYNWAVSLPDKDELTKRDDYYHVKVWAEYILVHNAEKICNSSNATE